MKGTLIAPGTSQSAYLINVEILSFACLLILASVLALVGGLATSMLFFGLLLVFSLLLLASRRHSATQMQGAPELPVE